MKCIKNKCSEYADHDFQLSYFICQLDSLARRKDKEYKCRIDEVIQKSIETTNSLKEIKSEIFKVNQG